MSNIFPNHTDSQIAERALLYSLITDPESVGEIESFKLSEKDFQESRHRIVFKHVSRLRESGRVIDYIILSESLKSSGDLERIGGLSFLVDIFEQYASSANINHYAELIKKKSLFREVLSKTKEIESLVNGGEISQEDLLGKVNQILSDLNSSTASSSVKSLDESISSVIQNLKNKNSITSRLTKTGFDSIDDKIIGISPGQLIVLAARPSMGKTALALDIGQNIAAEYNEHVIIFSLEMLNGELAERLISMESVINSQKFKSLRFSADDFNKVDRAAKKLSKLPVIIDDYSATTLARIRTQSLRYKAKYGKVRAIIIDYLQLMIPEDTRNGNKSDNIGVITRGLKILAKELGCPVILLSQLNRGVEGRDSKRPMLQDLRSSGDIEQDADMVWFIYRDQVYNPSTKVGSEAEIIIAKNRGGETGTVKLEWRGEFTKFTGKSY